MSQLRVGLVGAGNIASAHAPAWRALGADIHVTSLDGAEALAAAYHGHAVGSLEQLLAAVDVVDVVTPTPTHREIVEKALAAGKDVVCEKPLARTTADAVALVRAAADAGRHLYPGHVVRFFPEYVAMREAVRAETIGQPAVLRFSRSGMKPQVAWFDNHDDSGGVVMDLMIHDLDIARWVAGEVTSVFADYRTGSGAPSVEFAHAVLTHASGAISHVRGFWGAPHTAFRTTFDVAGARGKLTYDSAKASAVRTDLLPAPTGGEPRPSAETGESPYLTEIREFLTAIAGGPAPRVDAVDATVAVELAEAALESIRIGEPVTVDTYARVVSLGGVAIQPAGEPRSAHLEGSLA